MGTKHTKPRKASAPPKPLIPMEEGQVLCKIDTMGVHGFEQDGSGSVYRVTAEGTYTLNGEKHTIYKADCNVGLSEALGSIRDKIAKVLRPFKITADHLPLDITEEPDYDEFTMTRAKFEAFIGTSLDVGSIAEIVFKNGKLEYVELEHDPENFKTEEELADEYEDDEDEEEEIEIEVNL